MLRNWLKKAVNADNLVGLPKDNDDLTKTVNKQVETAVDTCVTMKKSRGPYNMYSPQKRAKIAVHAQMHGIASAQRKFNVAESTVRSIKKSYLKAISDSVDGTPITELHKQPAGRPLLLGQYDQDVITYLKKLQSCGGTLSRPLVIAAGVGIAKVKCPSLLAENGGSVILGKAWADSLLDRMGFVKRKGTKAAKKVPGNFRELKEDFLHRIKSIKEDHNIPPSLILNFDQTGIKFVPVSEWTLAQKGQKQVAITALEDKRQMTALITVSLSGNSLGWQLLYQGKTSQCHPNARFPEEFDVHHTESHWSNENSMIRFIDTILLPYITEQKRVLNLPPEQATLAIFDVFKAHRSEKFLKKLRDNNIYQVFVPGNCTGELQPLDLSVNDFIKKDLKQSFQFWYSEQIAELLRQGTDIESVSVNLKSSIVKPLNATWLVNTYLKLKEDNSRKIIISGFSKAGIAQCCTYQLENENQIENNIVQNNTLEVPTTQNVLNSTIGERPFADFQLVPTTQNVMFNTSSSSTSLVESSLVDINSSPSLFDPASVSDGITESISPYITSISTYNSNSDTMFSGLVSDINNNKPGTNVSSHVIDTTIHNTTVQVFDDIRSRAIATTSKDSIRMSKPKRLEVSNVFKACSRPEPILSVIARELSH